MDLTKMFVLVPSTSTATVDSIKTASLASSKIYFMAKYNQIVAKGTVYGVDPSTGKELESLVSVLGGTKASDGTVTVDFSGLNYYASEGEYRPCRIGNDLLRSVLPDYANSIGNNGLFHYQWRKTCDPSFWGQGGRWRWLKQS